MKRILYSICPDCGHPNVHVHGVSLAAHHATPADRQPCTGSGNLASEARIAVLKRGTREYVSAMAFAHTLNGGRV